jgi:hypothetical protein
MTIHHPDHNPYRHFTTCARVDKVVQTLQGFVRGITIDNQLNSEEVAELMNWGREYADLLGKAPFNELKEKLDEILADGRIDPEEQEDLLWVCRNLSPESDYYDAVTHDIQQLHGIMHGIMADGRVTMEEASGLQGWLDGLARHPGGMRLPRPRRRSQKARLQNTTCNFPPNHRIGTKSAQKCESVYSDPIHPLRGWRRVARKVRPSWEFGLDGWIDKPGAVAQLEDAIGELMVIDVG